MSELKEHEIVALLEAIPAQRWPTNEPLVLPRGSVGTIVSVYRDGEAYEIEFSDSDGQTQALVTVKPDQLLLLHHQYHSAVAA